MSWEYVALGELYEVHNGLSKGGKFFGKGSPFLSFSTVFNKWFLPQELLDLVQSTDNEQQSYSILRGDVFVTRTSETMDELGMSSVALKDYPHATYNGFTKRLRPINPERILPEFIGYYLRTAVFRAGFTAFSTMTTRASLRNEDLLSMKVPVPDMQTQKHIASILSAYDDLVESNQKQIKLLEEAAQRLYKEWFVDLRFPGHETTPIVDGIPEGWEVCKFSEIASIMSGGTPKTEVKEYYEGDIPFYTPKDSDGSFFVFDTITHISEAGLEHCNSQYYPEGTVIITARGTVGKTTILAVPMAMNQSCYALKCDELNSPYYLFFSLNKEVDSLKTMANGGVFNTIIVKTFDSISLTIPTQKVLSAFNAVVSSIMQQIKAKMKQNIHLAEARDRLLPKLMSGELEV